MSGGYDMSGDEPTSYSQTEENEKIKTQLKETFALLFKCTDNIRYAADEGKPEDYWRNFVYADTGKVSGALVGKFFSGVNMIIEGLLEGIKSLSPSTDEKFSTSADKFFAGIAVAVTAVAAVATRAIEGVFRVMKAATPSSVKESIQDMYSHFSSGKPKSEDNRGHHDKGPSKGPGGG